MTGIDNWSRVIFTDRPRTTSCTCVRWCWTNAEPLLDLFVELKVNKVQSTQHPIAYWKQLRKRGRWNIELRSHRLPNATKNQNAVDSHPVRKYKNIETITREQTAMKCCWGLEWSHERWYLCFRIVHDKWAGSHVYTAERRKCGIYCNKYIVKEPINLNYQTISLLTEFRDIEIDWQKDIRAQRTTKYYIGCLTAKE